MERTGVFVSDSEHQANFYFFAWSFIFHHCNTIISSTFSGYSKVEWMYFETLFIEFWFQLQSKNIIFTFLFISADFDDLLKYLTSMRPSKNRIVHTARAIFLTKCHWVYLIQCSPLFHLKDKQIMSHIISQFRKSLKKNFFHKNLGFQHIDRQTTLIQHQSAVTTKLLVDKPKHMILVADATCLKCEKSNNNDIQRATYSLHKHHHLHKPMALTTTANLILLSTGSDWVKAFHSEPIANA